MDAQKYPLAPMLRVRQKHEDQAKQDVLAAEERLKAAEEALALCQQELSRYRVWRPQEEDRRYAAIFGKALDVEKLRVFREQLASLAQGEVEREQKVFDAQTVVRERETKVQAARQALLLARKALLKLEKHQDIWLESMRKEEERLSDLEMEEVRGPAKNSE
ncbi:MAG: type III secretion protein [Desulfovibrio sp.]|nr:type III secretion protein [Desulfovibrio sp.]